MWILNCTEIVLWTKSRIKWTCWTSDQIFPFLSKKEQTSKSDIFLTFKSYSSSTKVNWMKWWKKYYVFFSISSTIITIHGFISLINANVIVSLVILILIGASQPILLFFRTCILKQQVSTNFNIYKCFNRNILSLMPMLMLNFLHIHTYLFTVLLNFIATQSDYLYIWFT